MTKKISTLVIGLLLGLMLTLPALADNHENEGVSTIVRITAKDGHEDKLLEGIEKYHKKMANNEGAMRYTWYETLTGPDTGVYYAHSGGHNWADFDADYDWQEEAGKYFEEHVAPHIASAQRMMTKDMEEYWHWPESMEGFSHFVVEHWHIKNGMYGKFNRHMKKIVSALKANNYPGYFGFYSVVSGGQGNEVGLVSPNKGWAGMSDSNPSFAEIMIKEMGSEEAFESFMTEFGTTFTTGQNMMLRYMPAASDYGD